MTQEERRKTRKYCNGTLGAPAFLCLHLLLVFIVIFLIIAPLVWGVLIPSYVQYRINHMGTPGSEISVDRISVGEMNDSSIHFKGDFRTAALMAFPLNAGFKPFEIHLVQKSSKGDLELAKISLPSEVNFWINKEVKLPVEATIMFSQNNIDNTRRLLLQLSLEGFKNLQLSAKFAPQVTAYGFTVYKSLALHRDISLGEINGSLGSLLKILMSSAGSGIVVQKPKSLDGTQLRSQFNEEDITKLPGILGGYEMVWKDLSYNMDDSSFEQALSLGFENPTVMELTEVQSVEMFVELEGIKFMKVGMKNLALLPGLNKDFQLKNRLTFLDAELKPEESVLAIEKAAQRFSDSLDIEFGVVGPIKIQGAKFVEEITQDMRITGKLSDLMQYLPASAHEILADPLSIIFSKDSNDDTLKRIFGNSKTSVSVLQDRIQSDFDLDLPIWSFLKPPKNLEFPYAAGISVFGNEQKVIEASLKPVEFSRSSSGMLVKTGTVLITESGPSAADALASALNPILALNPTV